MLIGLLFAFIIMAQSSMATAPNTFVTLISGFNQPYAIAITPNGSYAYVTDLGSNSVLVIDTNPSSSNFNTLVSASGLSGVFNQPSAIAITPNSLYAYVVDTNTNSVLIIDTNPSSLNFNTLISAPNLNGVFNNPAGIAITPSGLYAYVFNSGNNSLNVIDLNPSSPTYNQLLSTPSLNGVLNNPFDIAITPNGNYAYIANLTGSVTVIDTNPSSPTFNTSIAAPGLASVNPQPEGLAITADSLFAYVTDGSSTDVTVLDINPASPTFNTVLSAPNLITAFNAPNDVATTPSGSYYAYVTNFLGSSGSISSVSVIDTNPASSTYNSTLDTPGLFVQSPPPFTRFVTIAITPNARYAYAVDVFNNIVGVIYTGIIAPPSNFSGCKENNTFLLQKIRANHLTWSAPTIGITPTSYKIYRDAALTQLIATLPATTLQYNDYNTNDTYYITSVDDLGNASSSASTIIAGNCV